MNGKRCVTSVWCSGRSMGTNQILVPTLSLKLLVYLGPVTLLPPGLRCDQAAIYREFCFTTLGTVRFCFTAIRQHTTISLMHPTMIYMRIVNHSSSLSYICIPQNMALCCGCLKVGSLSFFPPLSPNLPFAVCARKMF